MRGAVLVLITASTVLAGCTSSTGAPTVPSTLRSTASSSSPAVRSVPRTAPRSTARTSPSTRSGTPSPHRATGRVVVLNPGHDGGNGAHPAEINRQVPAGFGAHKACDTTGTNTNAGYPEHAFTWDVTLRVRAILEAHGVRVVLTRPNDTGVGPCVDERAATGDAAGVAATISIHSDGAPSADHGFHVCYASRPPAGAAVDVRSKRLSSAIHDSLLSGSGIAPASYIGDGHGYFPRSDLAGLNLATGPATFLEIGNMRNAGDAAIESSSAGRARIATAVAAGILAYLG